MDVDKSINAIQPYNLVKDDPVFLKSLVNEFIKVQAIKNTLFEGFVHSVDPLTYSIILSVPKGSMYQTTLIPGHAILNIIKTPIPDGFIPPPHKEDIQNSPEEIHNRKIKLISWFKSNLLPVTETDENIVVGAVSVLPPYTTSDIYAENPVIALQITKIIDGMPIDFECSG